MINIKEFIIDFNKIYKNYNLIQKYFHTINIFILNYFVHLQHRLDFNLCFKFKFLIISFLQVDH